MEFPPALVAGLAAAQTVAVLCGAGLGAESGVPTFRDAQTGLWAQYRAEDLATPEAFQSDPQLVWSWYQWRRRLVEQAQPNPGHLALARWATRFPRFTLITQNVDGLQQRAGSRQVIELHGNLTRAKCFQCAALAGAIPATDETVPRCAHCGGLLRPDVVWFGESLPPAALAAAWAAAETAEVFFAIGTSGLVEPAASLPRAARRRGARLVEINLEPTPLSALAHWVVRAPAGAALPALTQYL